MKKLMRENKWKLVISSIVILLPTLFGIIMREKLPEQMAIHWGFNGEPDGWTGVSFAVLILPLILLVFHWLCILITFRDNQKNGQSVKVLGMVFWILPTISLFSNGVMYATAFGLDLDISFFVGIIVAVSLALVGNYMPKCKRNRTIGIKIKWTLANDENWNATHRFTGRVWVVCGLLMLAVALLPTELFYFGLTGVMLVAVILPFAFSYLFYKKQIKEGSAKVEDFRLGKTSAKATVVAVIIVIAALIFAAVVMFAGDFEVTAGNESLSIDAVFWSDLDIKYEDIDSIEYREDDDAGERINGYGAVDLLMGYFKNDEFGNYIRYSHGDNDGAVVIKVGEKIYVIGCEDKAQTKALYEKINAKVGK